MGRVPQRPIKDLEEAEGTRYGRKRGKQVKLRKPPVIEAWIEFFLDLSEEPLNAEGAFDMSAAKKFVYEEMDGTFDEKFEDIRYEVRGGFANRDGNVKFAPEVQFDRLRARNAGKNICLQVGRDVLVFNQLKVRNEWHGYEKMRDAAFDSLAKFLKYRGLKGVRHVGLSYRDLIRFPEGTAESVEKYLQVSPKYPDSFGKMMLFNLGLHLPAGIEETILDLNVKSVRPTEENANCSMLLMDWQMRPTEKVIGYPDFGRDWLDLAHQEIKKRFVMVFTPKGLDLFEPEEDGHD